MEVQGYGTEPRKARPTKAEELPKELLDAAKALADLPEIESVRIENGMMILAEFTPKSDARLAALIASRRAPKLAAIIAELPELAAEFREFLGLPRRHDGMMEPEE